MEVNPSVSQMAVVQCPWLVAAGYAESILVFIVSFGTYEGGTFFAQQFYFFMYIFAKMRFFGRISKCAHFC